jgi:DNA-binding protein HU-beta
VNKAVSQKILIIERRKQMNKSDLVNEVAKVVRTKKEAQAALDCVISSITKSLKKGEDVTLTGFGTFKVVKRKARKGRNPRTGEVLKIKASKAPKFVSGKGLKEAVK